MPSDEIVCAAPGTCGRLRSDSANPSGTSTFVISPRGVTVSVKSMSVIASSKFQKAEMQLPIAFGKTISNGDFIYYFVRISFRFSFWFIFSFNPMNIFFRNFNVIKKIFFCHSIITFSIIRRHTSFITPEEMNPRPVNTIFIVFCKFIVNDLRSVPA